MLITQFKKKELTMTDQNKGLLNRITEFALRNEGVRALALIGSSVRDDGLGDEFSDIDLFLVSDEPRLFVDDASWAREIGEYWFSFSESVPDARHRECRFLFSGGLDVDFVVIDEADLRESPDALFIAKAIASGGLPRGRGIPEGFLSRDGSRAS